MTTIKKVFYYLLLPLTAVAFIFKVLTNHQDNKVEEIIEETELKDKIIDKEINELKQKEAKIDGQIEEVEKNVETVDANWHLKD